MSSLGEIPVFYALLYGLAYPEQIIRLRRPRGCFPWCQNPITSPRKIDDAAHLGLDTRGQPMRICPRNPGTRTWHEGLREEIYEFFRIDEFRKGMCAGLDEAEHLLCRHDCKEIRQRRARNRREEKMTARLEATQRRKKERVRYMRGAYSTSDRLNTYLDQLRT